MSDDELLDMDYFLHEGDDDDEDFFGAEGFYIFWLFFACFSMPAFSAGLFFASSVFEEFPIK